MVIEGWTLINAGASYNKHGEEFQSAPWTTIDDQTSFWRIDGTWRAVGETIQARQALREAGVKPSYQLGLNLNELVAVVSDILGCDTRLKRGYTSYTLVSTHIYIAHSDNEQWNIGYAVVRPDHKKYDASHHQACKNLIEQRYPSRVVALKALNRELQRLSEDR